MSTIVLISIHTGPNVAASPSYVVWEAALRIVDGTTVVIEAPGPVRLDVYGNGQVTVPAGIWYVTEVVPGAAGRRRAVVVPESAEPVQYSTLMEVTNPSEIGFGPTWEQIVLNYAILAKASADDAKAYLVSLQGLVDDFDSGKLVRTVNNIQPDEFGNITITVSGTITVNSISDASTVAKSILTAPDGATIREIIGAGTGDGTGDGDPVQAAPSNLDARTQNADGSWPLAGEAPAGQILFWIGTTPPPTTSDYARKPSFFIKVG